MWVKSTPRGSARVDLVVVPPLKAGRAYAHTPDGHCVSFTGTREAMLALCSEHRHHALQLRGPVFVDVADWTDAAAGDAAQCWIHPLPGPETSAA